MLVLTSLWKQLLDCIANQSWKHQDSLFRGCGKSENCLNVFVWNLVSPLFVFYVASSIAIFLKFIYYYFYFLLLFFFQNSKIKFPLPHRIIKSHYKSKFVAKRPNTFYWNPVENNENPVETMKSGTGKLQ